MRARTMGSGQSGKHAAGDGLLLNVRTRGERPSSALSGTFSHPADGRRETSPPIPSPVAKQWEKVADRPDEGPSLPPVEPSPIPCYSSRMTKLEKIEQDIASLTPGEVAKLARWFAEFHADVWDRQIADDANAGRLDNLADQALASHHAGKTRPL